MGFKHLWGGKNQPGITNLLLLINFKKQSVGATTVKYNKFPLQESLSFKGHNAMYNWVTTIVFIAENFSLYLLIRKDYVKLTQLNKSQFVDKEMPDHEVIRELNEHCVIDRPWWIQIWF